MNTEINDTAILLQDPETFATGRIVDYSLLLQEYEVPYTVTGHYLQVGIPRSGLGWILNLSTTENSILTLLQKIIPLLLRENTPFKIIRSEDVAKMMLLGQLEYTELGKIITVFPGLPERALEIAQWLSQATQDFKGPSIPTDYHLGGTVYTRFGGYVTGQMTDHYGISSGFYFDETGQPISEEIQIPFHLPKGLVWPFTSLQPYQSFKEDKLLGEKYVVRDILKNDSKGRVMKVTSVNKIFQTKSYIVKEGIPNMASDAHGRDVQDKLEWQHEVSLDLEGIVSIPKAMDLFRVSNKLFFVMEYLDGMTLGASIDGRSPQHWAAQNTTVQSGFTDHVLFVIDFVNKLHEKGYYHRDITSRNFLITDSDRYGIDLELAYNYLSKKPDPPFVLGSPGYMSPEQLRMETPTSEQDIYGLGALMFRVYTGLSPKIFSAEDPEILYNQLYFLIGNKDLARLISSCMSYDCRKRPKLVEIKNWVVKFSSEILTKKEKPSLEQCYPDPIKVQGMIEKGIACLASGKLATQEQIWFSKAIKRASYIHNENKETTYLPGLCSGIGGVLYFLAAADLAGYDIENLREKKRANWAYLHNIRYNDSPLIPGLYYGTPGTCLAFAKGAAAGWVNMSDEIRSMMEFCLAAETEDLTMSTGLAGQGMALLQTANVLNPGKVNELMAYCTGKILTKQSLDGSWNIWKPGFDKVYKLSGFSHGMAGIIYYLLAYYRYTKEQHVLWAAIRGLEFLESACFRRTRRSVRWKAYPDGPTGNAWLDDGATGVVLTFIRAYSLTGDDHYREIAETTLRRHHINLVTPYLSVLTGAVGIGEVYLEAWQAFKTEEWRNRAGWITQLLLHTYQPTTDGGACWITDNSTLPTADLLTGSTGALLYLMRWLDPENIPFQIFN